MMENFTAIHGDALLRAAEQRTASSRETMERAARAGNIDKIEEAAREFEAVFIAEMLKPMFEGVNEPDPFFGGGKGEEIFNGMMVQEYGKILADRGGIGIADFVKAELLKIQEGSKQ